MHSVSHILSLVQMLEKLQAAAKDALTELATLSDVRNIYFNMSLAQ